MTLRLRPARHRRTVPGMAHRLLFAVALFAATPSMAEDWSTLRDCASEHMEAVDVAEPSLFDGARLIVDVLCVHEAADLGNQMARSPARRADVDQIGFAAAFESFLSVMRRETTAALFEVRKRRLSL